jgi:hypothetical protein
MVTKPPYAADAPMLKKLAPLGIKPGAPFSTASLSPDVRTAIDEGVAAGKAALAAESKKLGRMSTIVRRGACMIAWTEGAQR